MVPPGAPPALSRRGQIHTYSLARRSRRWGAVAPFPLGLLGLGLPRLRLTAAAVAAGATLVLGEVLRGVSIRGLYPPSDPETSKRYAEWRESNRD